MRGRFIVFQRTADVWNQQQVISLGLNGFGSAVDIDVDKIVIGVPQANRAYVYELSNNTWGVTGALFGSGKFGTSVAVDGNTVAVGAPDADTDDGQVTIYVDNGTSWVSQGNLTASDGVNGDDFGMSVDISGDWVIVGSPGAEVDDGMMGTINNGGAAYMFNRDGSSWSQTDRLDISSAQADDAFGTGVALDGERAVVGAPGRDRDSQDEGEAFSFGFKYGAWRLETVVEPLVGSGTEAGDQLGYSVALSGDIALLGAPQFNGRIDTPQTTLTDTPGDGYVYLREVSPPTQVTEAVEESVLLTGAQANVLSGTVNGFDTAELNFFDIPEVEVTTGTANDTFTVNEAGLTALGLQDFTVDLGSGDDTLNLLSANLTPPGADSYTPTGDFSGTSSGDTIPGGADYVQIDGTFTYEAGPGKDTIVTNVDADWRLTNSLLVANDAQELELVDVENASINGGDGGNVIVIESWNGDVTVDGADGSDQVTVNIGSVPNADVFDSGSETGDQLTVLGTASADNLLIAGSRVTLGANAVDFSGIDVLRVASLAGDDEIDVQDSTAPLVELDGGDGSDIFEILTGIGLNTPLIDITDSGPAATPLSNGTFSGQVDTLKLPTGTSLGAVDTIFSADNKNVRYDETIEISEINVVDPIQNISLTEFMDIVILDGATMSINGATLDMSNVIDLTIDALGGNDKLFIVSILPTLTKINFKGEDGIDTLYGPSDATQWNITGENAGTTDITATFDFSTIETLVGGTAADTYSFFDGGSLGGNIIDNGNGVLDFSAQTTAIQVDLENSTATGIGGTFSGVNPIIGTSAADTIIGENAENTWNITSNNAGNVGATNFQSFENLTGGSLNDEFNLPFGYRR